MFPEDRMMEVLIIGALALIVIGPKDLPIAMRKLGRFVGKLRGMAAEFRASFDELARQSELEELRKEVEALRVSRESVLGAVNPLADSGLGQTVQEIRDELSPVSFAPPMSAQIAAERAAAVAEVAPAEPDPVAAAPKPARKSRAKPKPPAAEADAAKASGPTP